MPDVTQLLENLESGDPSAAADLLPLVYNELRRLAAAKMAQERAGHTLRPTALVHEAWMRLVKGGDAKSWNSRGHFYSAASEAMRRILIEAARQKATLKKGGQWKRLELTTNEPSHQEFDWGEFLSLNEALEKLKEEDEDCYQLVMLRYFAGLTIEESAKAMNVSARTIKRNWSYTRAWLKREIDGE